MHLYEYSKSPPNRNNLYLQICYCSPSSVWWSTRSTRGSSPYRSYINSRKSRVMPTCSINERTDSSQQTIHFEPSNLRASFKKWYYHELRRQEPSLDEISVDNITDWQKGEELFGKTHNALWKLLNRVYNELERSIKLDRYHKTHPAHRFKVKLDLSPALNSAKRAQVNVSERLRFNHPFEFHTIWTLKYSIQRCMIEAYNVPYVTNRSV